ncbi:MAG: hypothetical protein R3D45_05320 [Rhizobiaceae bacterium]
MRKPNCLPVIGIAGLLATGALANENLDALVSLQGSEVRVTLSREYFNATLSISGPNDFHAEAFSRDGSPAIDLIRVGATADGTYTYEVTAASSEDAVGENLMDNGRGGVDETAGKIGASMSGTFQAIGGIINTQASLTEESE